MLPAVRLAGHKCVVGTSLVAPIEIPSPLAWSGIGNSLSARHMLCKSAPPALYRFLTQPLRLAPRRREEPEHHCQEAHEGNTYGITYAPSEVGRVSTSSLNESRQPLADASAALISSELGLWT
jgi:hypothetical protein